MTALLTRPAPAKARLNTRRLRIDTPARPLEVYPESLYLRRWAARQASQYQSLLLSIAAAPNADRRD